MPIYEFKCENCRHEFSLLAGINDRDKVTCPNCQSSNIRQLISGCSIGKNKSCGDSGASFGGGGG
ncbi:MAG: zinc ribbon domain-containing protein [Peptococcaceae bacterium]|nr:MAG: zinc ribbon domain-containing protein [Peptococcaceae bacterium]